MSKNIVIDSTYDEVNIAILNEHNGVTDNEKPIVCDKAKAYFQAGSTLYRKESGMISEYEVTTVSKYSCVIVAKKAIDGGKHQMTVYTGHIGDSVFFRKMDCSVSKTELSKDPLYKYYIGSAEIKKKREELEKKYKDYEPDVRLNDAQKKAIIKSYWEKQSFDEDRKFKEEYPRDCYARMDFDTELIPFNEEPIGNYYNKIYISKDPEYTLRELSGTTVWQVEAGMYARNRDVLHSGVNISTYLDSGIVVDWRAPIASIYDNDNEHTEMTVPSKGVSYKHSLMLKRRLPKNEEFKNLYIEGGRKWGILSKNDTFLEKNLEARKSSHMLEDIIETIQKNQNELIRNVKIDTDLVVQGCAGSGKTMVLLHRASVLIYNNPNIARANYDIITPNKLFDAHINELAERIKLEDVRRRTTEEVYSDILTCFDESFRNQRQSLPDSRAKDVFSAFVYSDEFKKDVEACIPDIREDIASDALKSIDLIKIFEINDKHELEVEIPIPSTKENKVNLLEKCYEFHNAIITKLGEIATLSAGYGSVVKAVNIDRALIAELYSKKRGVVSPDSKKSEEKLDIKWLAGYLSGEKKKQISKLMLENQNGDGDFIDNNYVVKLNSKTTFDEVYSILTKLNISCETLQKAYVARKRKYLSGDEKSYADRVRDLQKKASENGINWEVVKRFPAVSGKEDLEYVRASLSEAKERQANPCYKKHFERYYEIILSNKFGAHNDSAIYKSTLYAETLFCDRILKCIETTDTPKGLNFALGKYVFVDEGQDLSINEYKLIDSLFGDRVFNVFGDVKQLIKNGYGISDWTEFKQIRSEVVFGELSENFRNTKSITNYCNSMLGREDKAVGPDGEKVLRINKKNALSQIDNRVFETENSEERVAIIVHSIDDAFARTCLSRYGDRLVVNNICPGKVSLLTVETSKGIEFDCVFVSDIGMSDNERYIAYTRALSRLNIIQEKRWIDRLWQ